jgi:hypothetical protein
VTRKWTGIQLLPHNSANESMPLRKSTDSTATRIRICGVSWIHPSTSRQARRGWPDLRAGAVVRNADLGRRLTIRGEAHSVMQAINRQLAHYAYHTGQIVFLAKQLQHREWKSLSVPRGQS